VTRACSKFRVERASRNRQPCDAASEENRECPLMLRTVLCVGVVAQTERDHTPLAEIAMEFVLPEIQLSEILSGVRLPSSRDTKLRSIFEPFRKRGQRLEKTELTHCTCKSRCGGCRLCERMPDTPQRELASAIVRDAVASVYREPGAGGSTRLSIAHYHFGRLRCACIGERSSWICCGPRPTCFSPGRHLAVNAHAWAARRAGMERVAAWLAGRRLLLQTEVSREIEWLVATELLEIPCRRRDRVSYRDAIAETDTRGPRERPHFSSPPPRRPRFSPAACRCSRDLSRVAHRDGRDRNRFVAAGLGALVVKQATPGLVTLSSALGGDDRAQMADRRLFRLAPVSVRLWYSLFPAAAGPDCSPPRPPAVSSRRRHAGRLFRRRHRSLAAAGCGCIGEGSNGFCGFGGRPVRADRVEIGSCATIMSLASSIFRSDCPRNAGLAHP